MRKLRPPMRPAGADPKMWRTPPCVCGHPWKRHAPLGCTECRTPELGYVCTGYRQKR